MSIILAAYRAAHKHGLLLPYLKTVGAFTDGLWRAVRSFYRDGDVGAFVDSFSYWVTEQLGRAWREGARDVGVYPEDMEAEDLAELDRIIAREFDYVLDFAQAIEDARQAGSGYEHFRGRVNIWANRYPDVVNQARIWFGGKQRLEWMIGATEKHCASCSHLNGIVAWAKEWDEAGIRPQSPPNGALECGGWKCDCSLLPTDKRRSANALQRIMGTPKSEGHDHETK